MNKTTHDAATFSPDDFIICSGLGGIYRGYFRPPSSGTDGHPITYIGSDSPHFTAKELATGWTLHAGNVWKVAWTRGGDVNAQHLFIDGVDQGLGQSALVNVDAEGEWFLDDPGNMLYLYDSGGDPDGHVAPGIEINSVERIIEAGKSYTIFDGLHLSWASYAQIRSDNAGSHVTIRNCTCEYGNRGISATTTAGTYTDWEIYDNTLRYFWNSGIEFLHGGRESRIYRNHIHDVDHDSFAIGSTYTNGIKLWDDGALTGSVEIFENLIYDIGPGGAASGPGQGSGIWFDRIQPEAGDECVAYHNFLYNCSGTGVFIEISRHCIAYSNVMYNCGYHSGGTDEFSPSGMRIDTRTGYNSEYNYVYNNTVYGGRCGMVVAGYYDHTAVISYNEVKNNIFIGWTEHGLIARNGGDNTTLHGTGVGNVYEHNCLGPESNALVQWNYHHVGTHDGWEAIADTAHHVVLQDYWLDNTSQPVDGSGGYWWGIEVPLSGTGTVNVKRIFARLCRVGTPSNSTARMRIYDNNAGAPGTSIAETTLNISAVTTDSVDGDWYEFVFSSSVTLTKGSTYYFVMVGDWTHDNNNCVKMFGRTSGYTGVHHSWRYSGTWTETTAATFAFIALDDTYVPGWMHNVEGDPLLADVEAHQFWLTETSPCLEAGVDLGADYRSGLHPSSVWPDGVVTANQSGDWDMGAYIFPSSGGHSALPLGQAFDQDVFFPSSITWIV